LDRNINEIFSEKKMNNNESPKFDYKIYLQNGLQTCKKH